MPDTTLTDERLRNLARGYILLALMFVGGFMCGVIVMLQVKP